MSARHSWAGLDARSASPTARRPKRCGLLVLAVHRQGDRVRGEREGRVLRHAVTRSQGDGTRSDDPEELRRSEPRRRGEPDEKPQPCALLRVLHRPALEELSSERPRRVSLVRSRSARAAAPDTSCGGGKLDAEDAEPLPAAPDGLSMRTLERAGLREHPARAPPSRARHRCAPRAPSASRSHERGRPSAPHTRPRPARARTRARGRSVLHGSAREQLEPRGEVAERRRMGRRGASDATRAVVEVREPNPLVRVRGGPPRGRGDRRSGRSRRRARSRGRSRAATGRSCRCSSLCAASPSIRQVASWMRSWTKR